MPDPVRVRDNDTGHEYSTYAVDEDGNTYEGLTVLKDEPAVDATGVLLPPKYPEVPSDESAEDVVVAVDAKAPAADLVPSDPPAAEPEATTDAASAETSAAATKQSSKAPRPAAPTSTKPTSKES